MNKLKILQLILLIFSISLFSGLIWFIESTIDQYDKVNASWTQYSNTETRIVDNLLTLNSHLGYGGMIHHFKNYIIRGDEKYIDLYNQDLLVIRKSINNLEQLFAIENTSSNHQALFSNIRRAILEYDKKIAMAQQLYARHSIFHIDDKVKVDDSAALNALKTLRTEISKRSVLVQVLTNAELTKSHYRLANGRFFALPILLMLLLLLYYMNRIQVSNDHVKKANVWADTLLDTSPEATLCSNTAGKIVRANKQASILFGFNQDELLAMGIEQLIPDAHSNAHIKLRDKYFNNPMTREMAYRKPLVAKRKDDEEIEVTINLSRANDGKEDIAIATIRDVTEIRLAEKKLIYQATHDALTGLYNRHEFETLTEKSMLSAKRYHQQHALCFLDLDKFKVVNDTSGHVAGDSLLKQISVILSEHLRETDILARLGGDEFAILMENCTLPQAAEKSKEIIKLIDDYRFLWDDKIFSIGVSIGVTDIDDQSSTPDDIIKRADLACYAAKDAGRNRVHCYQQNDTEILQHSDEMHWVSKINKALEINNFILYAQELRPTNPQKNDSNFEFLIRMNNGKDEPFPPGAFLPAAERYNLITKIDFWVIDNAFRWLTQHGDSFPDKTHFAINLSGSSLGDEHVLKHIMNWLDAGLVKASRINFEVTETMAITNLDKAIVFIEKIRDRGCLFSLDDFGSGLSSFAYLKNLHVDTLKIDGVFVRDIITDPIDTAMVDSINNIGHVMGMSTVAEFVENDEIATKLISIGVDYLQGYGISKPVPLDEILK